MSMTKEEAKKYIVTWFYSLEDYELPPLQVTQALQVAISALRLITREQVEKVWRGEWILYLDGDHIMPERYYSCSKCGDKGYTSKRNFCDFCGAPMTDKAVQMVMERLGALSDE